MLRDKSKPKKSTYQDYHWLKRNRVLPSDKRKGAKKVKFDNEYSEFPISITNVEKNCNLPAVCADFNDNTDVQETNYNKSNVNFNVNGSVKNSNYYRTLASKQDILIGSLNKLTDSAFGSTIVMNNLTTQEFNLFNENIWLSTSSIEFVSAIIWKNSLLKLKTNVLSSNLGHYISIWYSLGFSCC